MKKIILIYAIILLTMGGYAKAANIVAQDFTANQIGYGGGVFTHTGGSRMGYGSFFQANHTYNLTMVEVAIQRNGVVSGNLIPALYNANSTTVVYSFIGNGSALDASTISTDGGLYNVTFSTPIQVISGQYYFFAMKWTGAATSFPTGLYTNRNTGATGYNFLYYDGTGDLPGDWVGATSSTQAYMRISKQYTATPYSITGQITRAEQAIFNATIMLINPYSRSLITTVTSNTTGGYYINGTTYEAITNQSDWVICTYFVNNTARLTKSEWVNATVSG